MSTTVRQKEMACLKTGCFQVDLRGGRRDPEQPDSDVGDHQGVAGAHLGMADVIVAGLLGLCGPGQGRNCGKQRGGEAGWTGGMRATGHSESIDQPSP